MLFQTLPFLGLMAVTLLLMAAARSARAQVVLLVLVGWFFYLYQKPPYLLLLLFTTTNDFFIARALGQSQDPRRRKWLVAASVVCDLAALAVFKYLGFFAESIDLFLERLGLSAEIPIINLALPVGISFYTFQSLGYVIDVYRRKLDPEPSYWRHALFVGFFPTLLSGPIQRAGAFLPQWSRRLELDPQNLARGCNLFAVGLFKKVVVADNLGPFVDYVFREPQGLPSVAIVWATVAFGLQLYCDFSGYTDMARGLARMLGIELALNFDFPYAARSMRDFWRRWHISLSSWLRDYLYIGLGGGRGGAVKTHRNLLITMTLCGLWHGAAWNFVLWGFYHGLLLSVERRLGRGEGALMKAGDAVAAGWGPRLRRSGSWLICQYLAFLGWLMFRSRGWDNLAYAAKKYVFFDFNFSVFNLGLGSVNPFTTVAVMALFLGLHLLSHRLGGLPNWLDRQTPSKQILAWAAAAFTIAWMWPAKQSAFIYFQF